MAANKTYVVINNRSRLWADLQSPQADGMVVAGDTVFVRISRGDTVRIEYQRPPPAGRLNPFEDPCYAERNQTVYETTYRPEAPTQTASSAV